MERLDTVDALFVHTHVPATLLGSVMDRIPTVVSIDATPRKIDSLGGSYQHRVQPGIVESAKWRLHAQSFQKASALIAWSEWAADSLVADYGVNRDRITVIPPGVTPSLWRRPEPRSVTDEPVRVLFVGGDFERKGGNLLVEAIEQLRQEPEVDGERLELHLVTGADVAPAPGVHVHRGLTPNSPELIELFHRCDIFALPTRGDCTPLVLAEAASAGLPAVATSVGAIPESVLDGVTGHLVEPTVASLADGLRRLVTDPDYRLQLGGNAQAHAAETMDAERNAQRLLAVVTEQAQRARRDNRVVLTVSGVVAPDTEQATAEGRRPVADYHAIASATGAEVVDWTSVALDYSPVASVLRRTFGRSVALAYRLYRSRHRFDTIITDGEQVGFPLATLFRLSGRRECRHIMIGHRLSPSKKTVPVRLLGLSAEIDEILVYCSYQLNVAERLFNRPDQQVRLIDFMVDSEFFRPTGPILSPNRRPTICAAGREFRDYPTLIEAVRGLDADVVIASASPWSKRQDNANTVELPDNVTVTSFTQLELRDQLDRSDLLVMPLQPTDFQAGITTILEAMSMERPVVCTATPGQTDVIVDGVNGYYVPPNDPVAMRQAIEKILADPTAAAEMGRQGRRLVVGRADIRRYARLFGDIASSEPSISELPQGTGDRAAIKAA